LFSKALFSLSADNGYLKQNQIVSTAATTATDFPRIPNLHGRSKQQKVKKKRTTKQLTEGPKRTSSKP